MMFVMRTSMIGVCGLVAFVSASGYAASYSFSAGNPDGRMATASRPSAPGKIEIESADDFILTSTTLINQATVIGLLPSGAQLSSAIEVVAKIYRVFPADSTNPPSGNVPSRTNSPSDIAFDSRDTMTGNLTFTSTELNAAFTAANSVLNGINKTPNQTTAGEGAVSGEEVLFTVTFTTPFVLPPGHYFFVPEVLLSSGDFYWLSTPAPPQFTGDLQNWIRNETLAPDWLRVGTDIVGGSTPPRFNSAFTLSGLTLPKGDFNRDGMSDVLWRMSTTGDNAMWLMNGASIASPAALTRVSDLNWTIAGIGDFNRDGKADVLWRHGVTGEVVIWLMNGTSIISASVVGTVADTNWKIAGVGDFDGDGKSDVVWYDSATGQVVVWLMNGTSISSATVVTTVADLNWNIVGVGDLDGDGKADLFWRNAATGENVVWRMNGASIALASSTTTVSNLNYKVVGLGDVNGDSKADVFWWNQSTGDVVVWLMNGVTLTSATLITTVSDTNYHVEAVADFDGDGVADLMWRKVTTGETVVWLMNGPAIKQGAFVTTVNDVNWQIAGPR